MGSKSSRPQSIIYGVKLSPSIKLNDYAAGFTLARIGDTVATAMAVYSHSDARQEKKAGELVAKLLCN